MAEEGLQLPAADEPQTADFPTSSLASLHLTDGAAVVKGSTEHVVDNPEPRSLFPVMMSSPLTQSQQQRDISIATGPEPSAAVQGKGKGA